jgi:hypothetical protein
MARRSPERAPRVAASNGMPTGDRPPSEEAPTKLAEAAEPPGDRRIDVRHPNSPKTRFLSQICSKAVIKIS